jgi:hypothetical protein
MSCIASARNQDKQAGAFDVLSQRLNIGQDKAPPRFELRKWK